MTKEPGDTFVVCDEASKFLAPDFGVTSVSYDFAELLELVEVR
jgi:hypothetical protein